MRKFIIYSDDLDEAKISVVTANNSEDALFLYCKEVVIKDPRYLDYVYSEQGHDVFGNDEEGPTYPLNSGAFNLRDGLTPEDAEIIFAGNVRETFKDRPEYYDLYLEYWHSDAEPIEEPAQYVVNETWGLKPCSKDSERRWGNYIRRMHEKWQFPEEMLAILAVKSFDRSLGKVVPIEELEIN